MLQRIAMLSVHTSPLATLGGKEAGGMNVYIRELSREFSRRGVEVDVFTRSSSPDTPRFQELAPRSQVAKIIAGPETAIGTGQIYHHLDEFALNTLVTTAPRQYDIMFSHYWLSGLVAMQLRPRWRIPFVQMFHTLAEMKNRVAQNELERASVQRLNCEGAIMHQADRLIAATPIERDQFIEFYNAPPSRIAIVPPGVDLARFKPMSKTEARQHLGVPPEHNMLLFVGRIQPLKGIDILLRALAIVKAREPQLEKDICVAIIGGDNDPSSEIEQNELARLNSLRSELGIEELVTFLGAKDQDSLPYYYSAAAMVIMPSHYESFGMVAIEAMACGTPVIASDVGGLSFSIEDGFNGYLVPGRNPEALAKKIILLIKYPLLREQLSEQAKSWVARFSWVNVADELTEVFEETISNYYGVAK